MKNGKIWFLALVAAMGGFLFGYDTAVISGAEQQIQGVFKLSSFMHGLVMSSALWGTVIGALFGGKIADRVGRKPTLLFVGAFYLISAVWSALAGDATSLSIARFIGGLSVGCSSAVAPIYISEISPAKSRGLMTAVFQLNVVSGMCASQFINMALAHVGENAWRWMLGVEAAPALAFFILCFFIIESPRWIEEKSKIQNGKSSKRANFWSKRNRRPILIAIAVAVFNQLSGINAVLYFMPRIYSMAGFTIKTAFILTALTSVFFVVGTVIGMLLIDRIGRKSLLILGGSGYVISLFAIVSSFVFNQGWLAAPCLILFIISHALGQGTVIWVLIAEIFRTSVRGQGQSVGAFTHWTLSAIITMLFPFAAEQVGPAVIFGLFGIFMVIHLLWAIFVVPETKGKTLEEITESMHSC